MRKGEGRRLVKEVGNGRREYRFWVRNGGGRNRNVEWNYGKRSGCVMGMGMQKDGHEKGMAVKWEWQSSGNGNIEREL